MRFREAIFAEAEDLPVDLIGELVGVAALAHPVLQALLERLEPAFAAPRRHGATELVGLAAREAGRDHREAHYLLLENRYAERALEDAPHCLARVDDRLLAVPASKVGMHHAALDR